MCKPLFTRELNCCLVSLLVQLPLPTLWREQSSKEQGPQQSKRVSQRLGQGEGPMALRKCLIGVAQKPQEPNSCLASAYHLWVKPSIEEGQGAVLVGIIEGNHLL